MLKASKLQQDKRIQEAKKLLTSALVDAKSLFTGIEPAKAELQVEYTALLDAFKDIRGQALYYPYIGSGLGKGPLVELMDGSVKFDLISGIGVHYFGHSSEEIVEQAIDAALSDTIMQGNLQQNGDALELQKLLVRVSGMDHSFLSTSGAMACENTLKICFQKKHPAYRVLAFERAFAGRTLVLSQITDKPSFRQGLPPTLTVDYIPFFDYRAPEESTDRAVAQLKTLIRRYPKQHAVMCMELVQGEGGFWTASRDYFISLITILKENGIAVWADEVQTFARLEKLFAFHYYELQDLVDIVTIGKVTPACATLFKKEFNPKPGLLSQTFTASTSAIRTAKFLIEHTLSHGFFGPTGKIATISTAFVNGLMKIEKETGLIHGPYGLGSMIAFTPYDGSEDRVKAFVQKLFQNGIISFTCGANPTRVRFLLPVGALSVDQVDAIMQILQTTLKECAP